ncbi:MAG: CRTAC1 family protein, partial [Verrucomicrobia bacterium]|nr:CRTAC1 family protein [Verrucomicrobiota bacterium]
AGAGLDVVGWVKGVAAGDYDNDGRPDLYISRLGEPNLLFRNEGPLPGIAAGWRFADVTHAAGVAEPRFSFPTWFFDFDNDGWEDLFVGGYRASDVGDLAADYLGLPHHAERPRLYRNRGDGTFQDVTHAMGLDRVLLAMGANHGDLDNDGWLDFYLGTGEPDLSALMPNRMFRNAGGTRFQDVTTAGGFGHLQKGHGVSFGDLDHDGDQDIYHVLGGAFEGDAYPNALFENPGHGHHWVKLQVIGTRANRSAIGARIHIQASGPDGPRTLHRTVSSGGSFGASPLRQEIGLGRCTSLDRVEVTWPGSGARQAFTHLPTGTLIRIREGDPAPAITQLTPTPFRKNRK